MSSHFVDGTNISNNINYTVFNYFITLLHLFKIYQNILVISFQILFLPYLILYRINFENHFPITFINIREIKTSSSQHVIYGKQSIYQSQITYFVGFFFVNIVILKVKAVWTIVF